MPSSTGPPTSSPATTKYSHWYSFCWATCCWSAMQKQRTALHHRCRWAERPFPPPASSLTPTDLLKQADSSGENSALAREKAWRDAQTEFEAAKSKLAEAERTVTLQQSLIQEKQEAVDELQQRRTASRQSGARSRVNGYPAPSATADRIKQQQEFLARQQAQQEQAVARIQSRLAEVEAAIASSKRKRLRMQKRPSFEAETKPRQTARRRSTAAARKLTASHQRSPNHRRWTASRCRQPPRHAQPV